MYKYTTTNQVFMILLKGEVKMRIFLWCSFFIAVFSSSTLLTEDVYATEDTVEITYYNKENHKSIDTVIKKGTNIPDDENSLVNSVSSELPAEWEYYKFFDVVDGYRSCHIPFGTLLETTEKTETHRLVRMKYGHSETICTTTEQFLLSEESVTVKKFITAETTKDKSIFAYYNGSFQWTGSAWMDNVIDGNDCKMQYGVKLKILASSEDNKFVLAQYSDNTCSIVGPFVLPKENITPESVIFAYYNELHGWADSSDYKYNNTCRIKFGARLKALSLSSDGQFRFVEMQDEGIQNSCTKGERFVLPQESVTMGSDTIEIDHNVNEREGLFKDQTYYFIGTEYFEISAFYEEEDINKRCGLSLGSKLKLLNFSTDEKSVLVTLEQLNQDSCASYEIKRYTSYFPPCKEGESFFLPIGRYTLTSDLNVLETNMDDRSCQPYIEWPAEIQE